jgi:murein DD-endopeptidase MepM/ murein hydrolase activator NlpD
MPHGRGRSGGWAAVMGLLLAMLIAGCAPAAGQAAVDAPATDAPASSDAMPTLTPLPSDEPPTSTEVVTVSEAAPTAEVATGATAVSEAAPTATIESTAEPATEAQTEVAPSEAPAEVAAGESVAGHYWFRRPIGPDDTNYLDRTYPYGGTSGGRLRPHTGGDFFNPEGTPVLAAGDATVIYAGTDESVIYGPQPSFYGNLIVLEMTGRRYHDQPVYTLYGHLSYIGVEPGQQVAAGDEIGKVGGTGIANGGSHLHFEVRIGDPTSYTATRNPDLWIVPYGGYGTLAGRIVGPDGVPLREVSITVEGEDYPRYTWTYAGDENIGDDDWPENFTYGDLPEGWYSVVTSSGYKTYRQRVYVQAGMTTLVEIAFNE